MPFLAKILIFIAVVAILNIPFGSYRNLTRKFSFAWFASIHLPIPLIIYIRHSLFNAPIDIGSISVSANWIIPFSISAAIFGQMMGKRFNWFGTFDDSKTDEISSKQAVDAESALE